MLSVIAKEVLEGLTRAEARKAIKDIYGPFSVGSADGQLFVEFMKRVTREDVVANRIRVILRARNSTTLKQLTDQSGLHRSLRTSNKKAGFRNVYVRSNQPVVHDTSDRRQDNNRNEQKVATQPSVH